MTRTYNRRDTFGVPIDFVLFGLTLLGVAIFHHCTLEVAVAGLAAISLYKILFSPFPSEPGVSGLAAHLSREWVIVGNLACLLLGFALLAIVFVLSAFLDNIAAALIGGAMAHSLFKKVHIGYLAAIVAASNAGGAGSVVGDATTTMMWIDGVSPIDVLHAYAASIAALFVSGLVVAFQQQRHSPTLKDVRHQPDIDWVRLGPGSAAGGTSPSPTSSAFS